MKEITPINNNGSILLRFTYDGERYAFTPVRGAKYSDQWDLRRVEAIATTILTDIEAGIFDKTLFKYKSQSSDSLQQQIERTRKQLSEIRQHEKPKIDLKDLWNKYVEYKKPSLSPSTLEIDFKRRIGNTLNLLPTTNIHDAVLIRDWLVAHKPSTQVKKILTQFNACCDWATDSKLIEANPFLGMVSKIKSPKKTEEDDINPFSAEERERIIQAFVNSRYYSHYSYLIRFLFLSGCRPSEALALTWSDINHNSLTFSKSYVEGNKNKRLKTQKKRTIMLNGQVKKVIAEAREYLSNLKEKKAFNNKHNLVFPSPEGNYIDWHNFSNRAWKKVLKSLSDIEYRNPYQTRHTFITLAIKANVSYTDIGKHCGNSPKVILDRYAGITRDFVMPEI